MTELNRNPGPRAALAIMAALAVTAVALCGLMVRARAQSEAAQTQKGVLANTGELPGPRGGGAREGGPR